MLTMAKKPASISPILQSMTQGLGLEKEMTLYQLKKEWPRLVGQTIAAHTAPEKIKFKTLTLLADGPTWMHELTFLKEKMIQKINETLGKETICTLHLRVGALPPPYTSPKENKPLKRLSPAAVALVKEALLPVSDEDLKNVIRHAMERHLRANQHLA